MAVMARYLFGIAVTAAFLCLSVTAFHVHTHVINVKACLDPKRNLTVLPGQMVSLHGRCARLMCDAGARRPQLIMQECEKPHGSCEVTPGKPHAHFPDCCDQMECSGHKVQHGKCFNPAKQEFYEKGSSWPLPNHKCGYTECKGFASNDTSGPLSWAYNQRTCGKVHPSPNCEIKPGPHGKTFPACCPRLSCRNNPRMMSDMEQRMNNDDFGEIEEVVMRFADF